MFGLTFDHSDRLKWPGWKAV